MRIKEMLCDLGASLTRLHNRLDNTDARIYAVESGLAEWRPDVELLRTLIKEKPLNVKLSPKQVQQVVERVNDPLVIPLEMAKRVAGMAQYGNLQSHTILGCGSAPIAAEFTLRMNGTIVLALVDCNGQRFWHGIFHTVAS